MLQELGWGIAALDFNNDFLFFSSLLLATVLLGSEAN